MRFKKETKNEFMFQKCITTLIDDGLGLLMTSHFVDYHFGYNGSTCTTQQFFPWFLKSAPGMCQLRFQWPKMADMEQIGGPLDLLQNFVGAELTTWGEASMEVVLFKFILAFNVG